MSLLLILSKIGGWLRGAFGATLALCLAAGAGFAQDVSETKLASEDIEGLRIRVDELSSELGAARKSYIAAVARKQGVGNTTFFLEEVYPIFEEICLKCHGEKRQRGGLRLDSRGAFIRGGDKGTIVVLGDPEASRIIRAVRREGDLEMPPKTELDPQGVEILVEWIRQGAPWPDDFPPQEGLDARQVVEARTVPPATLSVASGEAIDFSRDIQPLLSDRCYACHGPDAATREAGLRLDFHQNATTALASGNSAIVPGDLVRSQLFQRIAAADPLDRMPPSDFHKTLSEEEIQLLGRWVLQGAPWEEHWAFVPPKRAPLPTSSGEPWAGNPIDAFVQAKLEEEGLRSNPEADRRTSIRRLSLDLTGLPPSRDEIRAYLEDSGPDAYGRLVDRLMESPRYGENMARHWLDAARYADTNGYHIDNERHMWRWRDWVIDAFNDDKPFDEFTVEQVAGDLLPDPSFDQLIATGFNRNHMINFEGGAIPEEYRIQYVMDRLDTTATVWLGLTMHCAQCHDHKFDPISQKDFYRMAAYFNTVTEEGLDGREGNAAPSIRAPLPGQEEKLAELGERRSRLKERMRTLPPDVEEGFTRWRDSFSQDLSGRWTRVAPGIVAAENGSTLEILEDGSVRVTGENPDTEVLDFTFQTEASVITSIRLQAFLNDDLPEGGPGRAENGNFVLTDFEVDAGPLDESSQMQPVEFALAGADHSQDGMSASNAIDGDAATGWSVEGSLHHENRAAFFFPVEPIRFEGGVQLRVRLKFESKYPQHVAGHVAISLSSDPEAGVSELHPWRMSGPYIARSGADPFDKAFAPEKRIDLKQMSPDGRPVWAETGPLLRDGETSTLIGSGGALYLYRRIDAAGERVLEISLRSAGSIKVWANGELIHEKKTKGSLLRDLERVEIPLRAGRNDVLVKLVNEDKPPEFYFKRDAEHALGLTARMQTLLSTPSEHRPARLDEELRVEYLRDHYRHWTRLEGHEEHLVKLIADQEGRIPTTMVMAEMDSPRPTFILKRGQYDQPGEEVTSGTPAFLPPLPADAPASRLGLARWLVDPGNPLTSRVIVNRFWQQFFGHGIVKTSEDFGTQGARPSHPELLDWLAYEFVDSGWKVKELIRLIVSSAAYRQASQVDAEKFDRDPENLLYARGPRVRLDAETIRDSALAVGGLLVEKVGGPSVFPYQPPGLWKEVAYGGGFSAQEFTPSQGEGLYRRSMYTFWKRTSPPPSMMIFDAPNRETCSVRRSRSNTPLQALVLMNDPQFVEASRAFAERILREGGASPAERVAYAFETATAQLPSSRESALLLQMYESQLRHFKNGNGAAQQLIEVGDSAPDATLDANELAAWTMVANTILNMDSTITKS